jgi:hypothetical protein
MALADIQQKADSNDASILPQITVPAKGDTCSLRLSKLSLPGDVCQFPAGLYRLPAGQPCQAEGQQRLESSEAEISLQT